MATDDLTRNRLEALYARELKLAYDIAGKPLSSETLRPVAERLAAELGAKPEEVPEMFERAKEVADLPTKRHLVTALRNMREERGNAALKRIAAPSNGDMLVSTLMRVTGDYRIHRLARGEIISEEEHRRWTERHRQNWK